MKNNLYLVQFNHSYGKGLIMPYSVGVIWTYASQFSSIQKAYELKDIICTLRDKLETAKIDHKEEVQQAIANITNENVQLKEVVNKLRNELEQALIDREEHKQKEVASVININKQLKATINILRKKMETKEVQKLEQIQTE